MTQQLQRKLQSRHIAMIAIGGSIGTGIFIASGNAIFTAGPGGALLAYIIIGLMVYFLMTSLAEMSALIPVTGTFCHYSTRFVEPAFGFAMSYNYWFNWAITAAVDLSSASFVMQYWFPQVPFLWWSAIFFLVVLLLNFLVVSIYGESEYWLSLIKVATIIVFIVTGIFIFLGVVGHHTFNLSNWTIGDAPFHQGWRGFVMVLLVAGFAFQGTEIFGVTAGEAHNPRVSIPRAMRSVFWRILLFYIVSMFIIGMIIPYTDPALMNSNIQQVALSPFTIVFQEAGLRFATSFINAIILTAVLSACSASLYTATRLLWSMSCAGHAPKIFSRVASHGVPIPALIVTALIASVVFVSSLWGEGKVFIWLVNISSLSGFIAWIGIAISHYRFRKAYVAQGRKLEDLPYRSTLFPFSCIFALVLCLLIVIAQQLGTGFSSVDLGTLIGTYIGIPIFILLYLGYKFFKKSKLIPLLDCDFHTASSTQPK